MYKVPSKSFMATDFTSDLTHFLHNIVGAQLNIGGAQTLPKRYKVTPMTAGDVKGSMPPSIGHMELLAWMQRADFLNISKAANPLETP